MRFALALSTTLLAIAPGFAIAQNMTPADEGAAPGVGVVAPQEPTTSGEPTDMKGTQSMAPSSGNAPSGEPDSGMGRGQK
ncbi:MAG: hypothetical protein WDN46_10685 [Methylocella sp.]